MPVCKKNQGQWNTPTLMMRLVAQNGTSTLVLATDEAFNQFGTLELFRIYDFEISGKCVKNNVSGVKYGVPGPYEVKLKYPCKVTVASTAWPLVLPYEWTAFDQLNQCQHEAYVDVVGRLLSE
eukprot:1307352-Karenia_brevis.AAC.1